jgi:hypothetical protein
MIIEAAKTLFRGKNYAVFFTKHGWAAFWAIFYQTPLVTLMLSHP